MDSTASKVQKLNIQKSRRHNRATKRTNRRTRKKQKDGRTYFRTDGRTNEQTNKRTNARCVPLYAACSTSLSSHSYTVISFLSFGHIIPIPIAFLQKKEVTGNRRKHTLTQTAKGATAFKKAHTIIERELKEIFAVIPEKDRAKISNTFETVLTALIN